jgi:hypothetical protein
MTLGADNAAISSYSRPPAATARCDRFSLPTAFGVPMINALVSEGLATLTHEKVRADRKLVEVAKIRITSARMGRSRGKLKATWQAEETRLILA